LVLVPLPLVLLACLPLALFPLVPLIPVHFFLPLDYIRDSARTLPAPVPW
jgi:hypothetical protein